MNIFLVKALLMSVLPFYRVEFPMELFPKQFNYSTYADGKPSKGQTVGVGDAMYETLKASLNQEKQGWRYDFTTYAPAHAFDSPSMKINCLDSVVVANYKDGSDGWVQISKHVPSGFCPIISD
ncbi:MAG: hypothetical protein DM484_03240 [Candidatus Methylumidiphilus alinenensis]|uniref:Uncharacterized protein n=1 Tax=Candidatus Methylumidiphilus alinenensis TaxID=2202197 RepID=A0A2W4RJX5_9GAMM|nr:MAG: hypothetical protein DM484_03240 [Candidatus Methylumidiphilus alinenensis]